MAIKWPTQRRNAVDKVLRTYPKDSRKCDLAAKEIMPHARRQDASASKWRVEPKPGPPLYYVFLAPRVSVGGDPWRYHVFVETENHAVDALTEVDGTPRDQYLDTHFECATEIVASKIP